MSNVADDLIIKAKCLAIAPEEEILKTMATAAAVINDQQDTIEDLRATIQMLRDKEEDSLWLWQHDGEDYPESLCCPILIRPGDLRHIAKYGFDKIPKLANDGPDDYDRATDNGSKDDYDRAMDGV